MRRLVLLVALGAPGIACAQAPASPHAAVAATAADSVQVGCSGGVTGLGVGNIITRDGQLATYQKPLHEPRADTPLRQDTAAARAVFAALERIRFRSIRFSEISNMTCFLILVDGHGTHEVNWAMGRPPDAIEPALTALRRALGDDRRMWP